MPSDDSCRCGGERVRTSSSSTIGLLDKRKTALDKERQERVDYVGKLLMMGELPTFFNGKKRKARQGEGRLWLSCSKNKDYETSPMQILANANPCQRKSSPTCHNFISIHPPVPGVSHGFPRSLKLGAHYYCLRAS